MKALAILGTIFFALLSEAQEITISNLQVTHGPTTTYYSFNYTGVPARFQVLLDTDLNATTGYRANGIGARFLVENGGLYRYAGNSTDWTWTRIKDVTFSAHDGICKLSFLRSDLRSETGSPSALNVVARVSAPLVATPIVRQTFVSPSPTATPRPSPTATPTPTPRPSPTPVASVGFAPATCSRYNAPSVSSIVVKNEHPRVLLTRPRLLELRSQFQSGALNNNPLWTATFQSAKILANKSDAELQSQIREWSQIEWVANTMTFAAAVSKDPIILNGSKRIARYWYTSHYDGSESSSEDTYVRKSASAMAFIYDWLYDQLTATERNSIRADIDFRLNLPIMRQWAEGIPEGRFFLIAHDLSGNTGLLAAGLAIYHESAAARSLLTSLVMPNLVNVFFPFYDYLMDCDGAIPLGSGYSGAYGDGLRTAMDLFTTATNTNMFQRFPNFRNLTYYLAQTAGNDLAFMDGDSYDKDLTFDHAQVFARLATAYNDGIAKGLYENSKKFLPTSGTANWTFLVTGDSTATIQPVTRISKSKYYEKTGLLYARSGWQKDSVAPQVSALFSSSPYHFTSHHHRDMNHFAIYYRGHQLIDSGSYDSYGGSHWLNYYSRTIAHNSLTVFDPLETFTRGDKTLANDGGQQVVNPTPTRLEHFKNPLYDFGGITFAEDNADYTYGVARAEKAYSKVGSSGSVLYKKLNYYARHFLFLKQVTGAKHPVIIVYDDLNKVNANHDSKFLLHTINQPTYSNRTMRASVDDGQIQAQFLLPTSISASIIGGPGREFYVNGVNYPPTKLNSMPGAYRVEVGTTVNTAADKYLAVIYAGDKSSDPAPVAQLLSHSSTFAELRVGNYTVRFVRDDVIVVKD